MPDELPDNPRQWPTDPFRVLGVEWPATEPDLKRAYTRLIRRFKPEHHPEQFRLVREAYENALERVKWYGHFAAPPEGESEPFTPPIELRSDEATARREPIAPSPEEEAWALATSKKEGEAYARLLDLNRARPDSAEHALRLYWLLAVHPSLDAERSRHDWLAAALTRSRLTGPAVELYRRELDVNPEAALFGPYVRLLEASAHRSDLLGVARHRLVAAGLSRAWNVVDIDLQAMAPHAGEFDEVAWLSYLVSALGHLGFDFPAPAYARCRDLLDGLRHLELRESWAFAQLDEQDGMARVWAEAHAVPLPLRDVVRDLWTAPNGMWKRAMGRASGWVLTDPVPVLIQLDVAVGIPACRPLLTIIQRLIGEAKPSAAARMRPELIRAAVRAFLVQQDHRPYEALRRDLVRFLIDEAIDPDAMVSACVQDPSLAPRLLVQRLRADLTLQLVWQVAYAEF